MKSFDIPDRSMSMLSLLGASLEYEALFATSGESVLIVDASTERIAEANPSALSLLGVPAEVAVGARLSVLFESVGAATLRAGMTVAHVQQRTEAVGVRARHGGTELGARISLLRTSSQSYFLLRLTAEVAVPRFGDRDAPGSAAFDAIDVATFGFVMTDGTFRIDYANSAFVAMTNERSETELSGSSLDHWLTLTPAAMADLENQLARRIALTHFMTTLRWRNCLSHVAIEAICVPAGADSSWAFVVNETSAPN